MKLASFSSPQIPIDEINSFYNIKDTNDIPTRPYTWSNSICSFDGIQGFLEPESHVSQIGLKHIPEIAKFQKADFRLLNAGWAMADAVLLSGKTVREERNPGFGREIAFPDLIAYRLDVLGKSSRNPIHVIVSQSGDFPLSGPLFHVRNQLVLVFTILEGKNAVLETLERQKPFYTEWSNICLEVFDGNLATLLSNLKTKYGIKYMDVSAGGSLIRSMIDGQLLDEIRVTQVGHIVGSQNSQGVPRPCLFPSLGTFASYSIIDAPIIKWVGIRTCGDYFIFVRGKIFYRADAPFKSLQSPKKLDAFSILKRAVTSYRNDVLIKKNQLELQLQSMSLLENEISRLFRHISFLTSFSSILLSWSLLNTHFMSDFLIILCRVIPLPYRKSFRQLLRVASLAAIFQTDILQSCIRGFLHFIRQGQMLPERKFTRKPHCK